MSEEVPTYGTPTIYDDKDSHILLRSTAESAFLAPPDWHVLFHNEEKVVGKLAFNGPELKFEGGADASAKIFIDYLAQKFVDRLAQERKPLEDRIKELEELLRKSDGPNYML